MVLASNEQVREFQGVLDKAVGRLSAAHVAVLVAHPDAVCSALAVAADALRAMVEETPDVETINGGVPRRVGADETAQRLSERVREGASEELLTSDELAARVGLKTRQSVHDWLRKGKIIGWPGAKRGYVFPAGQFDDRQQPIHGLERVVGLLGNGYSTWTWLTTPRLSLDSEPPLKLLADGDIYHVVMAAEGDKQGDFA